MNNQRLQNQETRCRGSHPEGRRRSTIRTKRIRETQQVRSPWNGIAIRPSSCIYQCDIIHQCEHFPIRASQSFSSTNQHFVPSEQNSSYLKIARPARSVTQQQRHSSSVSHLFAESLIDEIKTNERQREENVSFRARWCCICPTCKVPPRDPIRIHARRYRATAC